MNHFLNFLYTALIIYGLPCVAMEKKSELVSLAHVSKCSNSSAKQVARDWRKKLDSGSDDDSEDVVVKYRADAHILAGYAACMRKDFLDRRNKPVAVKEGVGVLAVDEIDLFVSNEK